MEYLVAFLLIVVGALLWALIRASKTLASERKLNNEIFHGALIENIALEDQVQALEIGRDEQEENYEQQFLSHHEVIEMLQNSLRRVTKDRDDLLMVTEYHETNCLPNLAHPDLYYPDESFNDG